LKRTQIDELEKLIGQLESIYKELAVLSKKSPNGAVNTFKLRFVNMTLKNCNAFLCKKYKPFDDFNQFDMDDVPSNSDLTFIIAQYMQAMEKFRSDNIYEDSYGWYYEIKDSDEEIRTAAPAKIKK
jgi:hypothetical protein